MFSLKFHVVLQRTAWKVNLQPNFHRFICVGIIFPSFHAKQSRITPTEPLQLLFRYQRHEHMSQKKFFPVNMKISCLFSRFVGISLESWYLEQRINTEGAFRIFCHVNRFKKYVAALTSQVHCVKNVVQHARIIHMPCLYFCAGTRKREGDREKTGYDLKGSWKNCLPGMWFSVYMPGMWFSVYMPGMWFPVYMPGMWFPVYMPGMRFSDYMPGMWFSVYMPGMWISVYMPGM